MRIRLMLVLVAVAACGGGGGGGSDNPTGPGTPVPPITPTATTSVNLQNSTFTPSAIVVSPSAVVTFTNSDGISHNVNFASTAITSIGDWASGDRTATMPVAPGTYSYTCTIHAGMNGTVKVQ
jgi:plastocyanin